MKSFDTFLLGQYKNRTHDYIAIQKQQKCTLCPRRSLHKQTLANGNARQTSSLSYKTNFKVSKGAKIRNPYNQVPHLTQDTNRKVTNSHLDTTNESQEVSPFVAGDHKAHINRRTQRHSKLKTEKNTQNIHKRSTALERSVNYLLEGLNWFYEANLTLNSDVDQDR